MAEHEFRLTPVGSARRAFYGKPL